MKFQKKSFKEKCSGDVDVKMRDFKKSTKYKTKKAKKSEGKNNFLLFPPCQDLIL